MIQDPLTLYKLIILYMLTRVTFPLTEAQVEDFILDKGYTGFLSIQQTFAELAESGFVQEKPLGNRTFLILTEEGRQTLAFFSNRIGDAIKKDIDEFLKENELSLRNENSVSAEYYKSTSGEYEARLISRDGDITLMELTLSVPTKELAASICENWSKKNEAIYKYLADNLF